MSNDLKVSFRIDGAYAKRLKAVAERMGSSPNLAARELLIQYMEEQAIFDVGSELSRELSEVSDQIHSFREAFQAAVKRS